jgi:hypothetical protein
MKYSIGLALVDFIPNIAFLIGAFYLVKIIVMTRGKRCSRMVMAGALLVFLGGALKATWKLLYAAEVGDFQLMSQVQFALLAPGFLALVVAIIILLRKKSSGVPLLAMAAWKIPFLFVMTVSSLGCHGLLTFVSFKRGAKLAAAGFIVAFLGLLSMSMLASAEQSVAMQWVEEGINSLGQIGFMVGGWLLYKNYKQIGCQE